MEAGGCDKVLLGTCDIIIDSCFVLQLIYSRQIQKENLAVDHANLKIERMMPISHYSHDF